MSFKQQRMTPPFLNSLHVSQNKKDWAGTDISCIEFGLEYITGEVSSPGAV